MQHSVNPFCIPHSALLIALLLAVVNGSGLPAADPPRRPNILFIMTDQQRWDCVAANGNKFIQTPNLDRLAARFLNFAQAFVCRPCVCRRGSVFHRPLRPFAPQPRELHSLDRSEMLMQARLRRPATTRRQSASCTIRLHA
jgi:hypothetical protein